MCLGVLYFTVAAPCHIQLLSLYWLCWGLTKCQPLWIILCRLQEKGRKEIEDIVGEIKERDREERGTGMKGKKTNKNIPLYPYLLKDSKSCPTVSQYQLDTQVTKIHQGVQLILAYSWANFYYITGRLLTLVLLNPDMLCLHKQCWSGSALFVIRYVNLYQKPGSDISWLAEN